MVAKIDTDGSKIIFSIKGFVSVISFVFSIFFSFYFFVIVPKFENIEKIIDKQMVVNEEINKNIQNLTISVTVLNETIKYNNKYKAYERF